MATYLLGSHQECLESGMASVIIMDHLGAAVNWVYLPGSSGAVHTARGCEGQVEVELKSTPLAASLYYSRAEIL